MQYLLDTNICIAIINRRSAAPLNRLLQTEPGQVAVSAITVAELRYGATKSQASVKNHTALDNFLMPLEVVAFDESSVLAYGAIREELERAGALIGPLDTLIAAQAVAYSLIVVTNNERQFQGITKLKKIENWLL